MFFNIYLYDKLTFFADREAAVSDILIFLSITQRRFITDIVSVECRVCEKESIDKLEIYKTLFKEEKGATVIEYGLVAVLIAIVAIVVLNEIGLNVNALYQIVADALTDNL